MRGELTEADTAGAEKTHVAMATATKQTAVINARGELRFLAYALGLQEFLKGCLLLEFEGESSHSGEK